MDDYPNLNVHCICELWEDVVKVDTLFRKSAIREKGHDHIYDQKLGRWAASDLQHH